MTTAQLVLILAMPIYVVLIGFGAIWWDLRRRALRLPPDATAEEIEAFELGKLAELGARTQEIELKIGGVLDTVHSELEDARSERRSAASMKAGASKMKKDREEAHDKEDELVPPSGGDRESVIDAVRARYEH